jgi:hypothetical protein
MMIRSRFAAALLASLALAPVLAAGRPACCFRPAAAPMRSHGCCAPMSGARASVPKGCCKAPAAPKSEARVQDGSPLALSTPQTLGAPALASAVIPTLVSVHRARLSHFAAAPDDSPPDLLSQLHVLLI